MKIDEMRLHTVVLDNIGLIRIEEQNNHRVGSVLWNDEICTKSEAIAIAKRLCDRFNAGQEGK